MEGAKPKSKKKTVVVILLLAVIISVVITFVPFGFTNPWQKVFLSFGLSDFSSAADGSPFSMHVLEVGKADAIFVQCGSYSVLVDGGTVDQGETIRRYLFRRGIKKLDLVVNTHPDSDHAGGLGIILQNIPVDEFLTPAIPENIMPKDSSYLELRQLLSEKKIPVKNSIAGESIYLGDLKIEILGPVYSKDTTNNNSVVLRLVYQNTAFLLMGDAEKEEEQDILLAGFDLSSNVIKIGHHGSRTSTTVELLNAVGAEFAAISVAEDRNKLPNYDVIERLKKKGVAIYRTDVSGSLLFLSDGETVSVMEEKE